MSSTERSAARTISATIAALIGFAANSLLCRMALGSRAIDAASFTFVRIASGAAMLIVLARLAPARARERPRDGWVSALALFAYAAAFSSAYLRVSTGVGALVLFASVQVTMIGWSIRRGARPTPLEWLGLAVALLGLAVLTLPGAVAPDPIGVASMMIAGLAWGVYSLRGRANSSPLASTARNFALCVPLALAWLVFAWPSIDVDARGVWLALASGAVASGIGYTLWYRALPRLTATRAALVQLVVPVIAALAGVIVLGERPTARLVASGAMILGGVGTAVLYRRGSARDRSHDERSAPTAPSENA
jgi:drug/metabolite transporter (DMT)-like permease